MVDLFPLEARGLEVRRRGQRLIGPLDLTLNAKGRTLLIGPNGAGKTTLLKALYGLIRPSAGHVTWAAEDEAVRAGQAYVFQTPVMLRRTVRENLAYPLSLAGLPRPQIAEQVADWAARIGMTQALDRAATRLSGGERQKVALARALIRAPRVVFLDEPCASLDGQATAEIEALLIAASAAGTRLVMTSHNVGQIKRLATDFVFLHKGALAAQGSASDLAAPAPSSGLATFLRGDILP